MELLLEDIYLKKEFKKKLINKFSINLNHNGIYLITGKNGSGKTTIAKTLFNKYPNLITLMLQENDLILKEETVLDNINMYQDKKNEILIFLQQNELDYLLEKNPKYLSGGEKRLISLLQVLFSNRKIIILDEPSNDIDYIMFEKMKILINQFSQQKVILLISHDDRFDKYLKKYKIQNRELILLEEKISYLPLIDNDSFKTDVLKKIKNKNYNYIFYICFILLIIILLYSAINNLSLLKKIEPYNKYNKNVFHISSFLGTHIDEFNDSDSLNTVLIKIAFKRNKVKYYNKIINEEIKHLDIGINLKGNTIEKVYPQEYFNKENKKYYNIDEKSKNFILKFLTNKEIKLTSTSSLKDFVNNSNTFKSKVILPDSLKKDEIINFFSEYGYKISFNSELKDTILIDFNINLYNQMLLEFNNNYIITEALFKIKDNVELMDFIIDNQLDKKSLLIQGYDLYKLNIEINNLNEWMITIKSLITYFILVILLLIIVIIIYEKSNTKKYKNFYYYGFSIKDIYQSQKDYYLLKYISILLFSIGLITAGIIYIMKWRQILILILLISIICMHFISLIIMNFIYRKMRRLFK